MYSKLPSLFLTSCHLDDQGLNSQQSGMDRSRGNPRNRQVIWPPIHFPLGFSQCCFSSGEYLLTDTPLLPTPITEEASSFLLLPAGFLPQAALILKKGYSFSSSPYETKSGDNLSWVGLLAKFSGVGPWGLIHGHWVQVWACVSIQGKQVSSLPGAEHLRKGRAGNRLGEKKELRF